MRLIAAGPRRRSCTRRVVRTAGQLPGLQDPEDCKGERSSHNGGQRSGAPMRACGADELIKLAMQLRNASIRDHAIDL